MSAAELSRLDELVSRYLDDALVDSDAVELVAWLAEPKAAARFLEMTRFNSELAGLLAAPVPDEHTLRRHFRRHGTLSLLEDDLGKVAEGITTFAEIQSIGGLGFYTSPAIATSKENRNARARPRRPLLTT